jgi:hypothetical protein
MRDTPCFDCAPVLIMHTKSFVGNLEIVGRNHILAKFGFGMAGRAAPMSGSDRKKSQR